MPKLDQPLRDQIVGVHDQSFIAQCFEYLDDVRRVGNENMVRCAGILFDEFEYDGMTRRTSREIGKAWMITFNHNQNAADRVKAIYEA